MEKMKNNLDGGKKKIKQKMHTAAVKVLNACVLNVTDIFQLPCQRVSTKVCYLKGFAIGNVFRNLDNVWGKQNTEEKHS